VPCIADKLAEEVCEAERKDAEHGKALASGAASSSDQESGDALHYVFLSWFHENVFEALQQELKSCCPAYFLRFPCLHVGYSWEEWSLHMHVASIIPKVALLQHYNTILNLVVISAPPASYTAKPCWSLAHLLVAHACTC